MPSLTGLRALAVLVVMFGHLNGTVGFPLRWRFIDAPFGSTVLFVISGFLITTLLQREYVATGTIAVRRFLVRRAMRIAPALWVYVAVVLLLESFGVLHLRDGDALAALTYMADFRAVREWWLGHAWSLGIQEKFCLVWPIALAFAGLARGLRMALLAIVVVPLARFAVFFLWPSQQDLVYMAFPLMLDSLATGCALAMLRDRLWSDPRYRAVLESRWFLLLPSLVVLLFVWRPSFRLGLLVGPTTVHVATALCIDWGIRFPGTRCGRLLNLRPVVWIGTISYSLYLWQHLFLCAWYPRWFTGFPLNVVLAFCAATASYYLVERPFVRVRGRLDARPRPATTVVDPGVYERVA